MSTVSFGREYTQNTGIRNPFSYSPWCTSKSYKTIFETLEADIIILQELKIQRKDLTLEIANVPGYESFFTFPKAKKGYSGVAVYVKQDICMPSKAEEGLTGCLLNDKGIPWRENENGIGGYSKVSLSQGQSIDSEGRAIILDFGMFVLFGTYCPNNAGPERDEYRLEYLNMLSKRVENLIALGRQVVIAGDINVCRSLLDTADPKQAVRQSDGDYMSNPARKWLAAFLQSSVKDVVREFWPEREGMFTCWNTRINARPGNYGSRVDYILATEQLMDWIDKADIQPDVYGSDHCPVFVEFKSSHNSQYLLDLVNFPGIFTNNTRVSETPSPPRFAARYYFEFGSRNIKTMFAKMPETRMNPSLTKPTSDPLAPPGPMKRKGPPLTGVGKTKKEKLKNGQGSITNFLVESSSGSPSTRHSDVESQNIHSPSEPTNSPDFLSELVQSSSKQSSKAWSDIFTKRLPPNCSVHNEPCIQLVVKKPGLNCGRTFWICSRDVGPGYDNWSRPKEDINKNFRCGFFKWCNGS